MKYFEIDGRLQNSLGEKTNQCFLSKYFMKTVSDNTASWIFVILLNLKVVLPQSCTCFSRVKFSITCLFITNKITRILNIFVDKKNTMLLFFLTWWKWCFRKTSNMQQQFSIASAMVFDLRKTASTHWFLMINAYSSSYFIGQTTLGQT